MTGHPPNMFQRICRTCGEKTSAHYAFTHQGQCRWCCEAIPPAIKRVVWDAMDEAAQALARENHGVETEARLTNPNN